MNGEAADGQPVLRIEPVQLQFHVSNLVSLAVASNVLVMALATGRLLRINLDNAQNVEDIDLPKKTSDTGTVRRIFLDPTGSHLLVNTTLDDTFYLHSRSNKVKVLSRLKGYAIECVAWSQFSTIGSTKEVLLGCPDGSVHEICIEPADEYFKREDKYLKNVYRTEGPITGLFQSAFENAPDSRQVMISTRTTICHFAGSITKGGDAVYARFFERADSQIRNFSAAPLPVPLAISPKGDERHFAWLCGAGIYHGRIPQYLHSDLSESVFSNARLTALTEVSTPPNALILSHHHCICLTDTKVHAINLYNDSVAFSDSIGASEKILGLTSDPFQSTYWIYSSSLIYEIVASNEDRDLWKLMLAERSFDAALRFAKGPKQQDLVNIASADHLISRSKYSDAAVIYGKTSKSFEEVTLVFLENGERDALRKYLISKLANLPKKMYTQRTMVASWVVELYMAKLNTLDDTIAAEDDKSTIGASFEDFVQKYHADLDKKTTYEIISSHGRQSELLNYAEAISDFPFILSYWIKMASWKNALTTLNKQSDVELFYQTATILMVHCPKETVDIWVRHSLDPSRLIPSLLSYNSYSTANIREHQGIRYLLFAVNQLHSTDLVVHNTLVAFYAAHRSSDESGLLHYLKLFKQPFYDQDFALRLCLEHHRIECGVHIYSSMGIYDGAVKLALDNKNIELASIIADRADDDGARKKLWLKIAEHVVRSSEQSSVKSAISFLKQCELLRIEDLVPFFPDFVVIDDFKDEVCAALEDYSQQIGNLKRDMDESAKTGESIDHDIAGLGDRYAIVEPGEQCFICTYPLLTRSFYVFPCQHTFHADCLARNLIKDSPAWQRRKILDLQSDTSGTKADELDAMIANDCALCGNIIVNSIDKPLVEDNDPALDEWKIE